MPEGKRKAKLDGLQPIQEGKKKKLKRKNRGGKRWSQANTPQKIPEKIRGDGKSEKGHSQKSSAGEGGGERKLDIDHA